MAGSRDRMRHHRRIRTRRRVLSRHAVLVARMHPFAQALSGDHAFHIWDMPGYGRSSRILAIQWTSTHRHRRWPRSSTTGSWTVPTRRARLRRRGFASSASGARSCLRVAAVGGRGGDPAQWIAVLPVFKTTPMSCPGCPATSMKRSYAATSRTPVTADCATKISTPRGAVNR